jgi:transcriptional regulator with XRE-family HTH domain
VTNPRSTCGCRPGWPILLFVTTPEQGDDELDPAATDGEDLAELILGALSDTGHSQKELAETTGITRSRLNSWLTRERGTSRISPDDLRAIANTLRKWGATGVTPGRVFRATGRPVPGPANEERERRLLAIFRALPTRSQRALLDHAEAMLSSLSPSGLH